MKSLLKDLNWKFTFLAAFIISGVMIAEQVLLMKQTRVAMESRVGEKAAFINTFYSFLIADALQRKDDVTLLQVVNRLEEDPEVTGVVVVDDAGEVRYHADPEKMGLQWNDPLIQKALDTGDGVMSPFTNSGGQAMALVSPLKVKGLPKPIGAVRIDMTYRHIKDQLAKFDNSFRLAILGFIGTAVALFMIFIRRWVTYPLEMTEQAIAKLHLATAEPFFPESSDEFGRFYKSLNDMILRFRVELQEQLGNGPGNPTDVEKDLVEHLVRSFLPDTLVFVADKDNKIISYANEGVPETAATGHLLDLITDVHFANLVASAFQNEGAPMRGPIHFHDQPYNAVVLCLPSNQCKMVKTVIALQAVPQKGEPVL